MNSMERYISQQTLRRIEESDPILTAVRLSDFVTYNPRTSRSVESHVKYSQTAAWAPKSAADVTRLGKALAKGGHLERLEIDGRNGFDRLLVSNGSFMEGLKRNSSIRMLELRSCGDGAVGIVEAFEERCKGLSVIAFNRCNLGEDGFLSLADSLVKIGGSQRTVEKNRGEYGVGLKQIAFRNMNMTGNVLDSLAASMRKIDLLEELAIICCDVVNTVALSDMLADPNCNLRKLSVHDNPINSDGAIMLAGALAKNSKLEHLYLCNNWPNDGSVSNAFAQALCNTLSPNATFFSNHTLRWFLCNDEYSSWPKNLKMGLELNHSEIDKENIAMKKILQQHKQFDMTTCFEWELKMLPHVIDWFRRANACVEKRDTNFSSRKLDAIYQFTRAMPLTTIAKAGCWETPWEKIKRKRFGTTWFREQLDLISIPIQGALVCLFLAIFVSVLLSGHGYRPLVHFHERFPPILLMRI